MKRCPTTGKISYPSETEAVGPDTTLGIYFCVQCEGWHRSRSKMRTNRQRVENVRATARRRENFGTMPLALRLDPAVVEKLRKISEAD